jgi:purine-binding chemotaxis protein CheW
MSAADRLRILAARASAAAAVREERAGGGERVLAFRVGGERYALPVQAVSLVLDASTLGPLVGAPPWLLGAAVARARIVPVLDLRRLLGLEGGGLSDLTRVVVVERDGEAFGLAAEAIEGERDVAAGDVTPATSGPFVWVARDRTALLDVAALCAPDGA